MEQTGKLLITRMEREGRKQILSAFYEDGKAREFSCEQACSRQLLGNIYIGKVKNIVTNIDAAFVEIEKGILCYYSLRENPNPLVLKGGKGGKLRPGDELFVQVSKEALKTKAPTVTSNLNFPGKYLVLTTGRKNLGLSSRLSFQEKQRLGAIAEPLLEEDFGIVIRTNAAGVSREELEEELLRLKERCRRALAFGRHQTCFSLIYREPPAFISAVRGLSKESFSEIITDDEEIYRELKEYLLENQAEDLAKLCFYEKESPSLSSLYGMEKDLEDALKERVWLKSGAYLIIQPTEALTVIDVNTGKYDGRKKRRDTFLKINLEAAKEIARQLRLRNLSGMILADFIDMEEASDRETLMSFLAEELKKDPTKAVLVDMTPLGLVEMTRKKVRKTLREQVEENCK